MVYLTRLKKDAPEKGTGIRFAIYQAERPVGTIEAVNENILMLEEAVKEAKQFGAHLISFPELYLQGYTMTPDVIKELAETVDGLSITRVRAIAEENEIGIICPYAEKDESSGKTLYYDSIAVIDSDGTLLHNYRKTHLFGQAERNNYSFGYCDTNEDPYIVCEINDFPIGVLNCYEAEFFELSRILALKGAKLIAIPTAADYYYNLPDGKRTTVPYPDISTNLIPAHSLENHCFISYCNRSGSETVGSGTWQYRGNSIICGPHGDTLIAARNEDTLMVADIIPGDYCATHPEGAYLKNRRPELYKQLVEMEGAFEGGYKYKTPPE
ncbi:MAG TPA: carbon-nitrogen hydrolase family protein [Thermodesulfobacteriota bacterium]|nr:carbon-nitrogen hydrolase family protein [Thermodesulfobacteriota bacterium]